MSNRLILLNLSTEENTYVSSEEFPNQEQKEQSSDDTTAGLLLKEPPSETPTGTFLGN